MYEVKIKQVQVQLKINLLVKKLLAEKSIVYFPFFKKNIQC